MAALVQLFASLILAWPAVAEFPAGPGWEWVPSMAQMGGKEFGEVAEPLVNMIGNARVYPEIAPTPIQGWALSARVEPLWQAEGEGVLALVYEEVEVVVEAERRGRAVIAFRGHAEGNVIDSCALEMLVEEDDRNSTLVSWCYATYKAPTFDYYSQAVAYTMRVLEAYPPSSVLLSGASLGGMLADLAAAGVSTHYFTALPVVALITPGVRATMLALGVSLPGHYKSMISAANQWDPVVRSHWDNRIGTVCLFNPTEEPPPTCTACFAAASSSSNLVPSHHHLQLYSTQDCQDCKSLTHDPFLLLDLMLQGVNPTCYLMEDTLQLPPAFAGAE